MRHAVKLPDLTISSGATLSNVLTEDVFGFATGFVIAAPGTLPESVIVQVSLDDGVTWHDLQSDGADIVIAAGKAVAITHHGWDQLRLKASGAVAADRTFEAQILEDLT